VTATITDTGPAKMLQRLKNFQDLSQLEVAVGILAGKGDAAKNQDPELTVLYVAGIHEFGAPSAKPPIPERSIVRAWVDENEQKIRDLQRALAQKCLRAELTPMQAMNQLGAFCAGGIQQRISQGIPPPNATSTIERKGSSTPVIDTGQVRSSVTWKVRKRGET
jgi:hypothetical protein